MKTIDSARRQVTVFWEVLVRKGREICCFLGLHDWIDEERVLCMLPACLYRCKRCGWIKWGHLL